MYHKIFSSSVDAICAIRSLNCLIVQAGNIFGTLSNWNVVKKVYDKLPMLSAHLKSMYLREDISTLQQVDLNRSSWSPYKNVLGDQKLHFWDFFS